MTFIEKRQSLSTPMQLANIGSEVSRCIKAKKNKQPELFRDAYQRMLDLFTYSFTSSVSNRAHKRELCRAKEICIDFLAGKNEYRTTANSLMHYFNTFV